MASVTVVVPAYNEEEAIEATLRGLKEILNADGENEYRVVVVDDHSADETGVILDRIQDELDISVVHNGENMGYGASLKRGFARSEDEVVVTFDGDGQHRAEYVPQLVRELRDCDAVIGARPGVQGCPFWRVPGRWVLARLVSYLCGVRIPDFNSGLRAFRRDVLVSIQHLCSDTFSFSATSTMALYGIKAAVRFIPAEVNRRAGRSTVSPATGFQATVLALTSIMVFNPLRIFLPLSGGIGLLGFVFLVYGVIISNISDVCVILLLASLQLLLIGLVADQVAHIRKKVR